MAKFRAIRRHCCDLPTTTCCMSGRFTGRSARFPMAGWTCSSPEERWMRFRRFSEAISNHIGSGVSGDGNPGNGSIGSGDSLGGRSSPGPGSSGGRGCGSKPIVLTPSFAGSTHAAALRSWECTLVACRQRPLALFGPNACRLGRVRKPAIDDGMLMAYQFPLFQLCPPTLQRQ